MTIVEYDSRHEFLQNGKLWLLALEDGKVLGQISLEDHGTAWAWLNDLHVRVDHRRQGIGRRLVEAAVERCRRVIAHDQQALGCCAGIHPDNTASILLFRWCGFRWCFTFPDTGGLLFSRRADEFEAQP